MKPELLLILDRNLKPHALSWITAHQAEAEIVCLFVEPYLVIKSNGIPCHHLSDCFSMPAWKEIEQKAWERAASWIEEGVLDSIWPLPINLLYVTRCYTKMFFDELLIAPFAIESLVDHFQPKKLILLHSLKITSAPPFDRISEFVLFQKCIEYAKNENLSIQITPNDDGARRRKNKAFWTLGKQFGRFLKVLIDQAIALARIPKHTPALRILGIGEDYDAAIISQFLGAAVTQSQKLTTALLLSNGRNIGPSLRSGADFDSNIDHIRFSFEPPVRRNRFAELRNKFIITGEGAPHWLRQETPEIRALLGQAWDFFELISNQYSQYINFFKKVRPDWLVITDMASPSNRALSLVAKGLGCKTLGIPHGFMDSPELFSANIDAFLAWGPKWDPIIQPFLPKNATILHQVGSNLENLICKAQSSLDKSNGNASPTILFLCSGFYTTILSDFNSKAFFECWDAIFSWFENNPQASGLCQLHPSKNYRIWLEKRIEMKKLKNLKLLSGTRAEESITIADLVVDLGKPSTASFIALMFQKPTIFCSYLTRVQKQLRNEIFNDQNFFQARNIQELLAHLENTKSKKFDIQNQNSALPQYFSRGNLDFTLDFLGGKKDPQNSPLIS